VGYPDQKENDMRTDKRGMELLRDPSLNKSTAFTEAEKQALGIVGLVPDVTETQDLQLSRVMMQLGHKSTDIDRYIYLVNLLDHNEALFYRALMSDPARFLPIVYDPTIAEACLKFGHIYRQARGMYLSITRRGKVKEILKNWPEKDVRFICVTDGGRILGLGDLGANGAGIPIGKLELYTACAGVPPRYLLPMYLDAGTNNEQYLRDPLYLGLRKTRPSTADLYSFVDEFVEAVQDVFPKCCIHFEDWTGVDRYCVYNDDVQGTAGIVLAGMINAAKLKGTKLSDEKYLFLGAGSAGIGLAGLLCSAMVDEGLTIEQAQSKVYMFDVNGLLETTRTDLVDFQTPYAHRHAPTRDFVAAIESIRPTTIIGVSTIGGAFTQKVIEAMSRINKRPVVLALSNPTDHAECTAEQAYTWSNKQLLHLPGCRNGNLRDPSVASYRRDVHRGSACGGGSGAARFTEPRAPLSASVEHFGDRGPNGGACGKAGVRFGPCPRRAPGRHGLVHSSPRLQAGIFRSSDGGGDGGNEGGLIAHQSEALVPCSTPHFVPSACASPGPQAGPIEPGSPAQLLDPPRPCRADRADAHRPRRHTGGARRATRYYNTSILARTNSNSSTKTTRRKHRVLEYGPPRWRRPALAAKGWLVAPWDMRRQTGAKIIPAWRRNLPRS
jgi:malate dehydrogenase (oxaloacetate-decarboxylating)(NADP+)